MVGVEELAGDFCRAGQGVNAAIDRITGDGAACGRSVDADLMGAAGMKTEFE